MEFYSSDSLLGVFTDKALDLRQSTPEEISKLRRRTEYEAERRRRIEQAIRWIDDQLAEEFPDMQ